MSVFGAHYWKTKGAKQKIKKLERKLLNQMHFNGRRSFGGRWPSKCHSYVKSIEMSELSMGDATGKHVEPFKRQRGVLTESLSAQPHEKIKMMKGKTGILLGSQSVCTSPVYAANFNTSSPNL